MGAGDAEAAAFVEETFGDFFEAVGDLPEVGIDDFAPFCHAVSDKARQLGVFYFVSARHGPGVLFVDDCRCGAVVAVVFVVVTVDRYGELLAPGKSDIDVHDYRLVFVGAHDAAEGVELVAKKFSHNLIVFELFINVPLSRLVVLPDVYLLRRF